VIATVVTERKFFAALLGDVVPMRYGCKPP